MNMQNQSSGHPSGLRWLVLDLNSFFASCEQQENPTLRGQPLAVVPMLTDSTCAIAASYEAKAFGIKTGTPVWEAKQLCRNLRIVKARPKLYVEYHHRILDAIESCIPVEDVLSIDEVACRLDRKQQDPEQAKILAQCIKATITSRVGVCLTSSIGIASNKLLAKLASDMQKPDGLVILRTEDMPRAILHLQIDDICGIGRNMSKRLRSAGITDIPSLWAADGSALKRIWGGVMGLRFHALLHGEDLPSPQRPRRSMGHQHVLAPDDRSIERAVPIIRQLLIRATQRLRSEDFYCRRLMLDIKWVQELGYHVVEKHFQETQDTNFLLGMLGQLMRTTPKLKPLRVGVTLADLVPVVMHQPDLFDRPKPAALMSSIDKINDKFGRGTIAYGGATPEMTSKIAFQRVPKLDEL